MATLRPKYFSDFLRCSLYFPWMHLNCACPCSYKWSVFFSPLFCIVSIWMALMLMRCSAWMTVRFVAAHLLALQTYVVILYVHCSSSLLQLLTFGYVTWNADSKCRMFNLMCDALQEEWMIEHGRLFVLLLHINGCTIVYRLLEAMKAMVIFSV